MKDYLLSEIKAICDDCVGDCDFCEISHECDFLGIEKYPTYWKNIEPRDMIELPCKYRFEVPSTFDMWAVIYRGANGRLGFEVCDTEQEADDFLQELKNGKV